MSDTIEVFISYSKQDKELRDGLLAHLRPLEREGIITWHDRQILPGTEWNEEIKARLNAADIILLLISADFLATDYCTQVEIPEALRRHEAGEATVIPIILRACGWKYTSLAKIQAYPEKAEPIKSWKDIDEAYASVVDGVYLAARNIKERRSQQQAERLKQQELERQQQIRSKQEVDRKRQQDHPQQPSPKASGVDYAHLETLLNPLDQVPGVLMPRRVFFSFHYQRDIWRVNVVRNHAKVKSGYQEAGYWDCSLWESTKRTGENSLKQLINSGLQNTSVTVVLIGTETSERKWVKYEIEKSYERGNGMLGIYIHNIKDGNEITDLQGRNPFDSFTVEQPSAYTYMSKTHVSMSQIFPTYDWVYNDGYNNFSKWVEDAARAADR